MGYEVTSEQLSYSAYQPLAAALIHSCLFIFTSSESLMTDLLVETSQVGWVIEEVMIPTACSRNSDRDKDGKEIKKVGMCTLICWICNSSTMGLILYLLFHVR